MVPQTMMFVLIVGLAVTIRVVAGRMDRERIERYARDRGWRLISCEWQLFGPGWFGSQHQRIYRVRYEDDDGARRSAFIKTSALAGVYVTEER